MEGKYDLSFNDYFKDKDLSNNTDPLTGVLDRRTIFEYVEWLISQGRHFALFLIDIDNFKNVNDSYGHIVGDIVITQSAQTFVNACGVSGVVGRYGGDEFIIVYEDLTDYQDVWSCANHLTHMPMDSLEDYGLPNFSITVTVGIVRFPLDANNLEDLIKVADKALYRGKTKGRHCFIIYLPEKHAHISLQGDMDKRQNLMQLCGVIFNSLTASGEDVALAISTVFKSLVAYYMFDHICIETHKKLNHSVIFPLSVKKKFKHIPYNLIDELVDTAGFANINDVQELNKVKYTPIIEECVKQGIYSSFYCKISAYGKDYGFIRVDTANTSRIWQNEEMSMIIVTARTIGLLLHYQGKTLEDLPIVAPVEAGGRQ
ncbi:MAG: GGDEF domain-containing protein [Candidatus Coproplasma sp.]